MKRLLCALIWICLSLAQAEPGPLTEPTADRAASQDEAAPVLSLMQEIELLEDVQAGLSLALAACAEEAYCVTALNEQEMQRMRERLNDLFIASEPSMDAALSQRYQALLDEQVQLQQTVAQVTSDIDRDALEGNWSDQFEIDAIVVGPQVPFPNADISLSRFEDLNQPLPIE